MPCCAPCSITHTGYGPCPEQLTAGQKKTSVMTLLEKDPMPDPEVWTTSAQVIRSRDYNGEPNMQACFLLPSQILRNDRRRHKQKTKTKTKPKQNKQNSQISNSTARLESSRGFLNKFFTFYFYIFFGCVGSLLLHAGFLQLR